MAKANILQSTVNKGLCLSCGLCHDACPKKCIEINKTVYSYHPVVDNTRCIECGLCQKICPGFNVEIGRISKENFYDECHYNKHIGYYHRCYSGYSFDEENRLHSASGGCLTSVMCYLLDKKLIDGAVVVGFEKTNVTTPCTYIARTKEEILQSRGSKYSVVSFEGIIPQIMKGNGRYVVVGLPCVIHGFRKYEEVFKKLRKNIFGYFAIYCSSCRTQLAVDYLCYRYNVDKQEVRKFEYRGNGCLGYMTMYGDDYKILKQVPYEHYWQGMRGFFNSSRCSLCIDHYGELADVSFGDIHIGEYIKDKVGINSLFTRSSKWTNILLDAHSEGYICIDEVPAQTIIDSQKYAMIQKKGSGVANALRVRELLGKSNPIYDLPLIGKSSSVGMIKEFVKMSMRMVGKYRCLWWLIKKLDRNND